jgi:hypothetical protein
MGSKGFQDLILQCWLTQTYESNWAVSILFERLDNMFDKAIEDSSLSVNHIVDSVNNKSDETIMRRREVLVEQIFPDL